MAQQNKKPPGPDQSRNEYIPSFISKRPFWAETTHSDADYLEHQRLQSAPKDTLDKAKWYDRGKKQGPAATKFRKGACENCGAMTHKTKECLSRPRKQGARWTGKDIQADEVVEDVQLGWDAKRDRWNGYDSREYSAVVKEYEELEAIKRAAAGQKEDGDGTATPDSSDARYGEETDMGRSQPTSTRQLRLREDTANYLKNLDLDSARYDPKTRSMDKSAAQLTDDVDADEGFIRPAATNDDAAEFERAQRYAWETQENNANPSHIKKLHLQANPTEGEILRKKQTQEAAEKKAAARKALLEKYGGDEYLAAESSDQQQHRTKRPKHHNVVANERYVEYDESGHIKGSERTVARSKYPEDIFQNNHTSVWGSWWKDFNWGYACCHSTVKNSYCTGEEGRRAWEASEGMRTGQSLLQIEENGGGDTSTAQKGGGGEEAAVAKNASANTTASGTSATDITETVTGEEGQRLRLEQDGDDGARERKERLDEANTATATAVEGAKPTPPSSSQTTRKRTLQELQSGISEEELESYKRNRMAADDPMAELLGKDELIEMK